MSRKIKLQEKLLSSPIDFTWSELQKLLSNLGYKPVNMGKTSGSRVRFIHKNFEPLILHKPHPRLVLKKYQIKQIIEALKSRGQL